MDSKKSRTASHLTYLAAFSLLAAYISTTPANAQSDPQKCSTFLGNNRIEMRANYDNTLIERAQKITRRKIRNIGSKIIPRYVIDQIDSPPLDIGGARGRIEFVMRNREKFDQFKGTTGILLSIVLDASYRYLYGRSSAPFLRIVPHGEIFNHQFNDDGSGFVENRMCFEVYTGQADPANHMSTYMYQVKINIAKCGFVVHERVPNDPDGEFPGSFISSDLAGVSDAFQYKLEATAFGRSQKELGDSGGPGPDCVLTPNEKRVPTMSMSDLLYDADHKGASGNSDPLAPVATSEIRDSNGNGTIDPEEVQFGIDHGGMFNVVSPNSCIDIFFVSRPSSSVTTLVDYDYCMGRCTSPLIVNTGA